MTVAASEAAAAAPLPRYLYWFDAIDIIPLEYTFATVGIYIFWLVICPATKPSIDIPDTIVPEVGAVMEIFRRG
jgi:hypothetical protein